MQVPVIEDKLNELRVIIELPVALGNQRAGHYLDCFKTRRQQWLQQHTATSAYDSPFRLYASAKTPKNKKRR